MKNHKIELPQGCNKDDIVIALLNSAKLMRDEGYPSIAKSRSTYAFELDEMNPEPADVDLTEVGADCHCDQRDADEIPVYLKADEIEIVAHAVANITFGMCERHDWDSVTILKTIREVLAYLPKD